MRQVKPFKDVFFRKTFLEEKNMEKIPAYLAFGR
jgi:hypothetical protein